MPARTHPTLKTFLACISSIVLASGCRVVSTYQAAPPILATPSDSCKGEITTVLPSLTRLPTMYYYGPTTHGIQGWYRPAKGLLVAAEGFFWHDVSKFTHSDGFLNNRIPIGQYSGMTNGLSVALSLGAYRQHGSLTWVLLGGYAQEYAYVRHYIARTAPNDVREEYKEVRQNYWGKPFVQGHVFWRIMRKLEEHKTHFYCMAGYRTGLLIDQGVMRTIQTSTLTNMGDLKNDKVLKPVFSPPHVLTLVHQPFFALKVESHRLSGSLRGTLNFSSNDPYLHGSLYQIETVLGLRF